MKNAKIFLVEDKELIASSLKNYVLETNGHQVVLWARSLAEAIGMIPRLQEHGVDLAIVDGNLTENDISCNDGRQIVKAIRELGLPVKIIPYGTNFHFANIGDAPFRKGDRSEKLLGIIAEF